MINAGTPNKVRSGPTINENKNRVGPTLSENEGQAFKVASVGE